MIQVHVLYGGDSPEREVSLASGSSVCEGLKKAGYRVIPFPMESKKSLLPLLNGEKVDLAFIALHGGWGEDGMLQAALEMAGVPFTGSGPGACLAAMDKELSRALFASAGVPHPAGRVLRRSNGFREALECLYGCFERWGELIVKPSGGGSTVGVSRVRVRDEIEPALEEAWRFDAKAVVEQFIAGTELTVTVMEEAGQPFVLPAVQILPASGFYSYDSKYTPGATEYLAPAPLGNDERVAIEKAALCAHRSLGCRGYSRVDFRVDSRGFPFVLEVNTAPGMTGTSLVPKAAGALGWTFAELLDRIVKESL